MFYTIESSLKNAFVVDLDTDVTVFFKKAVLETLKIDFDDETMEKIIMHFFKKTSVSIRDFVMKDLVYFYIKPFNEFFEEIE